MNESIATMSSTTFVRFSRQNKQCQITLHKESSIHHIPFTERMSMCFDDVQRLVLNWRKAELVRSVFGNAEPFLNGVNKVEIALNGKTRYILHRLLPGNDEPVELVNWGI